MTKEDYHRISFSDHIEDIEIRMNARNPWSLSCYVSYWSLYVYININPDGGLRGTISGESAANRIVENSRWRGLCYIWCVLLTDEQSAYINFISKPIRSRKWKGRRRKDDDEGAALF